MMYSVQCIVDIPELGVDQSSKCHEPGEEEEDGHPYHDNFGSSIHNVTCLCVGDQDFVKLDCSW